MLIIYYYICSPLKEKQNDSVAQLVEHYTFNVGVLGSNPSGITEKDLRKFKTIHYQIVEWFFLLNTLDFFRSSTVFVY